MKCRHCANPVDRVFIDLGMMPPSNAYLTEDMLATPQVEYPLRVRVCTGCWLVQTEDYTRADELFASDYAYFSSTSESWLDHARRYCGMIQHRLALGASSFVVEVASNDGYLLRNFVAAGVPCLGIEPTDGTAEAAEQQGIPVVRKFFGERMAGELPRQADLIIGNNVYAHVPDINDFTRGLKAALKPDGTITLEFPHLLRLIGEAQFDTIYHEHYSYLSLGTVQEIFGSAGLRVYDVEKLPTHGGSLRVYGCHDEASFEEAPSVRAIVSEEIRAGLRDVAVYDAFQSRADVIASGLYRFLQDALNTGRHVVGYGAAAKGNTLLNYAGITPGQLPMIVDAAPSKQGKFMPGSRIPIRPVSVLQEDRPELILILPWNIADEVCEQLQELRAAGTRFYKAIPEITEL